MDRFQYLGLMAACLAITLPLEFVLGARVYRQPKRTAKAIAPAFIAFVAWDLWATHRGTWGFDDRYTIGVRLPGDMVIEELVFFIVIPLCTLLTLEAVRSIRSGAWRRRGPGEAEAGTVEDPVEVGGGPR